MEDIDSLFESDEFALTYLSGLQVPQEERLSKVLLEEIVTPRLREQERAEIQLQLRKLKLNTPNLARAGLRSGWQSLLHAIYGSNSYVREAFGIFKKAPLSKIIAEHIGHRPHAVFFTREEFEKYEAVVEEMIEKRGAVYLKENLSDSGFGVCRISKQGGKYRVQQPNVNLMKLYSLQQFPFNTGQYVLEEEIPIARVAGRTWEIRMIAPYGNAFTYGKVAATPESHLNNYAKGGYEGNADALIKKVLEYQGVGKEEREEQAQVFMTQAADLAKRVKELTDAIQVHVAKEIFRPEDLRIEATSYETVMAEVFSGTFFVVDITGVFENKRLNPMIIEAQAAAGLPAQIGYAANESVHEYFNQKCKLFDENIR